MRAWQWFARERGSDSHAKVAVNFYGAGGSELQWSAGGVECFLPSAGSTSLSPSRRPMFESCVEYASACRTSLSSAPSPPSFASAVACMVLWAAGSRLYEVGPPSAGACMGGW